VNPDKPASPPWAHPDYLVRLDNRATVILEIKGFGDDQTRAKPQAAKRWISAVNHWGKLGCWAFHVYKESAVAGEGTQLANQEYRLAEQVETAL
jgi:hypothetical protein